MSVEINIRQTSGVRGGYRITDQSGRRVYTISQRPGFSTGRSMVFKNEAGVTAVELSETVGSAAKGVVGGNLASRKYAVHFTDGEEEISILEKPGFIREQFTLESVGHPLTIARHGARWVLRENDRIIAEWRLPPLWKGFRLSMTAQVHDDGDVPLVSAILWPIFFRQIPSGSALKRYVLIGYYLLVALVVLLLVLLFGKLFGR